MQTFELTKNCLATEDFSKCIITDDITWELVIYVGCKQPVTYLIMEDFASNPKMLWLSTAEKPKYFAIQMEASKAGKNRWAIVRLAGGTRLCELEDVTLVEDVTPMQHFNAHRKALCMIDNKTSKCYELTVDNMLHLGKISKYLDDKDIEPEDHSLKNSKSLIKILGLPAPSCFPKNFL
jgi:hypothetical protein